MSVAVNERRTGIMEEERYYMSLAFLSAQRSGDPCTQVGACIVNGEKKIVGIGYNDEPNGWDKMPWMKYIPDKKDEKKDDDNYLNSETPYVCHAELNAVLNKTQADLTGCSMYVTLCPCNQCAQIVVQSGIKEVVYYSDEKRHKRAFRAGRRLLAGAGVSVRQYDSLDTTVEIDFGKKKDEEESEQAPYKIRPRRNLRHEA